MELLRDYKRKKLTRKYSGEEKIRFLWKVMEPPEEFAEMPEEAKKAKKEIQEEDVARTKARKLAKEALKSRLVLVPGLSEFDFDWFILYNFLFRKFHLCSENFFILLIFLLI